MFIGGLRPWLVALTLGGLAAADVTRCARAATPNSGGGIQPPTPAERSLQKETEELDRAFNGADEAMVSEHPSSPKPQRNVPSVSTEDETAHSKMEFERQLTSAMKSLSARKLEEGEEKLDAIEALSKSLGALYRQRWLEVHYRVVIARPDAKQAQKEAEQWLLSCVAPPDGCRRRALSAWERAARGPPPSRSVLERIRRIRQNDACVLQAKAAGRYPDCARAALAAYRQQGDAVMVARLLLAKGRISAADPKKAAEAVRWLDQAQKACEESKCLSIRRLALRRLVSLQIQLDDREAAAKAALTEMSIAAAQLPPDRRPFARTSEVERTCQLLDERKGPGACRRLEKSLLGGYSFRDFAKEPAARTGLTSEAVRTVNEHFGVMIHDCLSEEMGRLRPPAVETYHLFWTVSNDGRVNQVRFERKDQETGPLAECLRRQFSLWRYPKYRGEWQNIDQSFVVKAQEHSVASEKTP